MSQYEQLSAPNTGTNAQVTMTPQEQPGRSRIKPRQRFKMTLYRLGVTEIILGCLSLLLSIVTLIYAGVNATYEYRSYDGSIYHYSYHHGLTYSSQGLWGGIFIVVCGILGIKARNTPSVCMYNANMVLSIIAATVMGVVVVISCIAAPSMSYSFIVLIVIHSMIAVIAFAGMIVCIIHSAYCCAGVCCRSRHYQGTVMYIPPQCMQQPQQMVRLANGQYMMVPCQTMTPPAYPFAPVPVVDNPVAFHPSQASPAGPQMNMPPQTAPSTSFSQQAAQLSKEQEAQMQSEAENPPRYSTLPRNQDNN